MNAGLIIIIIVVLIIVGRRLLLPKLTAKRATQTAPKRPIKNHSLYTVRVFAKLSTRRFFRDRLAIFFTILFPLIFLFVFGGIFGHSNNNVTFKVAVLNESNTSFAKQFEQQLDSS